MAELHVQRKRNRYLWVWFVLAVIIIAGALYYYINYYQKKNQISTTKTGTSMIAGKPVNSDLLKIKYSNYVS
jgi:hypothetical protein